VLYKSLLDKAEFGGFSGVGNAGLGSGEDKLVNAWLKKLSML